MFDGPFAIRVGRCDSDGVMPSLSQRGRRRASCAAGPFWQDGGLRLHDDGGSAWFRRRAFSPWRVGLQGPWILLDVWFDEAQKEVHVDVQFRLGSRFACLCCGTEGQRVHGTRRRTWEHLRFFEHKTPIYSVVPPVACGNCSKFLHVPAPRAVLDFSTQSR